jgi:lipid II:glycine glycyltransferase (peptidoglycan interpeptide bridge formation enzyme)
LSQAYNEPPATPKADSTAQDITLDEIGEEWDARWDDLAGSTEESGFMQSSAWAAFKRSEGYQTTRLGLLADGRLIGGASLLFYPAVGTEGFWICPEGPILPWDDLQQARRGLRLIQAKVEALAEIHGGIGIRIEPHLPPPRPSLLRNWTRAPVDLNPIHSLLIDLTQSDETLLSQMHPKGRYNLGLSRRHGVQVTRSTSMSELRRFHALFIDTANRGDFFAEPYGFFLNLGANLFPAGMAELYFSEYEGETLATLLVIYFGRRATYLFGGSSTRHRNVMPAYAAHWAAINGARERGCVEYDFYGYDPFGQPDHLYAGFSRFKKQFGGFRKDSVGAYDLLFYDRLAESLVSRLT